MIFNKKINKFLLKALKPNYFSKNFILGILFLILFLFFIPGLSYASFNSISYLDAKLLYYEPVPAHPGEVIDVYLTINNIGSDYSKKGFIKIINSNDLKAANSNDKIIHFPSIPPGNSFLIKTKILINKNANEGTRYLSIELNEENNKQILKKSFPITIKGYKGSITILNTITKPEIFMQGKKGELMLSIKNVGDTKLRNINLFLDLNNLPFSPIKNSNSKTIKELNANSIRNLTFYLVPFPDAESQTYNLPLTISYEDERGDLNSQKEIIGLPVASKPEIMIYIEKNTLKEKNEPGTIIIKFVNKGLDKIKLLTASIKENNNFELLSDSNNIYVGDIDSDDYETASLIIKPKKENFIIPLKVNYKDSLNNDYEKDFSLRVKLIVNKKDDNYYLLIIVILILLVAFIFFKKIKKRNK